MGIDTDTVPKYVNIVINSNEEYLDELKKEADNEGQNDGEIKNISVTSNKHNLNTDEYYFDSKENSIIYSGSLVSTNGESYLSLELPLSDDILIDILQHSIKKFNKLKSVLENLSN